MYHVPLISFAWVFFSANPCYNNIAFSASLAMTPLSQDQYKHALSLSGVFSLKGFCLYTYIVVKTHTRALSLTLLCIRRFVQSNLI